jgi:hypothetical protein
MWKLLRNALDGCDNIHFGFALSHLSNQRPAESKYATSDTIDYRRFSHFQSQATATAFG